MASAYLVDFTVTLGTVRWIEADTEEQAISLAKRLLDNEKYREDLIASWLESYSGWGDPNEPTILCIDADAMPDYTAEELKEIYGVEV